MHVYSALYIAAFLCFVVIFFSIQSQNIMLSREAVMGKRKTKLTKCKRDE